MFKWEWLLDIKKDVWYDDDEKKLDVGTYILMNMAGMIAAVVAFLLFAGVTAWWMPGLWFGIGSGVISTFLTLFAPYAHLLHPLRSVHPDFHRVGQEFIKLPREDRAMFPHSLVKTMSNHNLSSYDRTQIRDGIYDTIGEINNRNLARKALEAKHVDISGILEAMNDSRRSVKIETDTFREFYR